MAYTRLGTRLRAGYQPRRSGRDCTCPEPTSGSSTSPPPRACLLPRRARSETPPPPKHARSNGSIRLQAPRSCTRRVAASPPKRLLSRRRPCAAASGRTLSAAAPATPVRQPTRGPCSVTAVISMRSGARWPSRQLNKASRARQTYAPGLSKRHANYRKASRLQGSRHWAATESVTRMAKASRQPIQSVTPTA